MIKRKTIETVEEYDANGKLVRKETTEIIEDDDTNQTYYPYAPSPWWSICPPYPPEPNITRTTTNTSTTYITNNSENK